MTSTKILSSQEISDTTPTKTLSSQENSEMASTKILSTQEISDTTPTKILFSQKTSKIHQIDDFLKGNPFKKASIWLIFIFRIVEK